MRGRTSPCVSSSRLLGTLAPQCAFGAFKTQVGGLFEWVELRGGVGGLYSFMC